MCVESRELEHARASFFTSHHKFTFVEVFLSLTKHKHHARATHHTCVPTMGADVEMKDEGKNKEEEGKKQEEVKEAPPKEVDILETVRDCCWMKNRRSARRVGVVCFFLFHLLFFFFKQIRVMRE